LIFAGGEIGKGGGGYYGRVVIDLDGPPTQTNRCLVSGKHKGLVEARSRNKAQKLKTIKMMNA
jgi:hypothetical protein